MSSLWEGEERAITSFGVSIASTFVIGISIQAAAVRILSLSSYSTLVFGLAIGNVANAIASAIQPVVAVGHRTTDERFVPCSVKIIGTFTVLLSTLAVLVMRTSVGLVAAAATVSQVPIHALVAVGQGRLQAKSRLVPLAISVSIFAFIRLVMLFASLVAGVKSIYPFILALPIGLLGTLGYLHVVGAFRQVSWKPIQDKGSVVAGYLLWASLAWLVNADAIYARILLPDDAAGSYAVAFTLGRLPLFAVAPLAMVLLPVTAQRAGTDQTRRLTGIVVAGLVLVFGSLVVLAIQPAFSLTIFTGNDGTASFSIVRLHALIGSFGAVATLLWTFAYASGQRPPLVFSLVSSAVLIPVSIYSGSAVALALGQLCIVITLLASGVRSSLRGLRGA